MRGESQSNLQNGTSLMTDTRRASADVEPDTQDPTATTPDPAAAPAERGEADPAVAALAADALAREAAELRDRLLRTLAEMENLRRRTDREVTDSRTYGISSFARDILAIADNMARALQTLRAELKERADPGIQALLDGVELTERELSKVLEKHGVRKFEPQPRDRFDPNLHQAMYEVQDPALPAGTVAQVVQAGYMIGDRMLRPALVAVAKNAPKPAAEPVGDAGADAEPGSEQS